MNHSPRSLLVLALSLLLLLLLAFAYTTTPAFASSNHADVPNDDCTTWYDTTQHGPNFRNVMTYGAKGDGVTDDTAAIQAALTQGRTDAYSVADPAVVYFPAGTYKVTDTLHHYFNTYVYGNLRCRPTLVVPDNSPGWSNGGYKYIFESDDFPDGEHTGNFYHGIANLAFDLGNGNNQAIAIHWAVSQASYLRNVSINARDGQMGIFGENGSPTFFGDIDIVGGQTGMMIGAQQYALKNINIRDSKVVCFNLIWDWGFTINNLNVANCPIGVQFQGGAAGAAVFQDSTFSDHTTAILSNDPSYAFLTGILLERVTATNVQTIAPLLPGNPSGTVNVQAWYQGIAFAQGSKMPPAQGTLTPSRPDTPLPLRSRPFFDGATVENVYDHGAKGDGVTDDTQAIQAAINTGNVVFFPCGTYLISSTLTLQSSTALVGEGLSILLASASSSVWSDAQNPAALIYTPSDTDGDVYLVDLLLSAQGNLPGLSFVEWRVGGNSAVFDVIHRVEYTTWALLHLSENGGGYFENLWGWIADHDINTGANLTVNSPRGFLCESSGPTIMYGTAFEHSALYQYNLTNCNNILLAVSQTETPYWQAPPTAWGMTIHDSSNVTLYTTGFYNWFHGVQESIFEIVNSEGINLYNINTVNSSNLLVGDRTIVASDAPNWFSSEIIADTPF